MKSKTNTAKKQITDKHKFIILICLFGISIIASIFLLPVFLKLNDSDALSTLIDNIKGKGIVGIFIFLFLQILQIIIAVIPGEVVEIGAGMLYGAVGGLAICVVGILISTCIIFITVKKLGYNFIQSFISEHTLKKFAFLHDNKKLEVIVFILFLIPGTPKDILTYFIPLTDMKLSSFLVVSTLARIPSIISSTYAGSTIYDGNLVITVIIFAVTGILGILGIIFNDKIIHSLHKTKVKNK